MPDGKQGAAAAQGAFLGTMKHSPSSQLSTSQRLEIYYFLYLTRRFDERMVSLWKQGRGLGTSFSARGHEAVSVGCGYALENDDMAAPMHRNVGTHIVRGVAPGKLLANYLGKSTGATRGRDANMHGVGDLDCNLIGFISHIPQSMSVALGAAMSFKYRGQPQAALTVCGDGASTAGTFHETLNMAAIYQAPLVIILENNQYAYSTPVDAHSAVSDLAEKASAHGVKAQVVDGNDVEAMYFATYEYLAQARKGGGPGLIEAKTMRMLGHALHDGAEYVPKALLATWENRDPVSRYRSKLQEIGLAETDLAEIEAQVELEMDEAITFAEDSPFPEASTVTEGVYAK